MARRVLRGLLNSLNIDGRSLYARRRYGVRGARLCQGRRLGRRPRHHRVAADFFHSARAAGASRAWLAGPRSAFSAAMQLAALVS